MVVMMMMMMMMVAVPVAQGSEWCSDHDAGVVVVMMMVVMVLCQLDVAFLRGAGLLLIHQLE